MKEVVADFPITSVTLYPDSARICRKTTVELSAGESVIKAAGLPGALETGSIRVEVLPESKLVITGISSNQCSAAEDLGLAHTKMMRELEELMMQRQMLQNRISAAAGELDLFVEKASLADHEAGDRFLTINVESWKEFYPFLRTRLLENRKTSRELVFELMELQTKIDAAKKNMASVSQPSSRHADIEIHCEAGIAGSFPVSIYYLADNTGWYPCYTLSADMQKNILTVSMQAIVNQATGEDWKAVELLLATAHPLFSCTIPKLVSRRLREIDADMQITKRPAPAPMQSMEMQEEAPMDRSIAAARPAKGKRAAPKSMTSGPVGEMADFGAMAGEELEAEVQDKSQIASRASGAGMQEDYSQPALENMTQSFDQALHAKPRQGLLSPYVQNLANLIAGKDEAEPEVPVQVSSLPGWCQAGTSLLSSLGGYDYRFQIHGRRDIVSSACPQKIMAAQKELGFESSYVTVPLEKEDVYLKAHFANDQDNPLPEGPAQVYADQSLLGAIRFATLSEGEFGDISLGIDKDIKIKR
ncbi:MAG: mucoidy inhibitor MuiA family protein, partial [Spirochaetaceae bacterium]